MEHPRLLRPPPHLRFHPTKGTVPEMHLSHSLPSRVGVYCPSGHYAAPYPSWAGQLGALRAMLVHHAPPPATQTLPCLVSRLHHDPHRAIARNPDDRSTTDAHQLFNHRRSPTSIRQHLAGLAFDHCNPRRGQPGAPVRRSSVHRELHGQYSSPR